MNIFYVLNLIPTVYQFNEMVGTEQILGVRVLDDDDDDEA
jgi:hypothetical protein